MLEFRADRADIGLVNATTTTETTMSDDTMGYCRTCRERKPETAFPTISRPAFPGMRDWEECRACKAERREARKSPDYIHPDVQAVIDRATAHGFEVRPEIIGKVVFVNIRRVHRDAETRTVLDLVNGADVMNLTFRRLSGGLVSGTRYGWKTTAKVKTARDAISWLDIWAI